MIFRRIRTLKMDLNFSQRKDLGYSFKAHGSRNITDGIGLPSCVVYNAIFTLTHHDS